MKYILFLSVVLFTLSSNANNAFYLTLSNQIARKQDLQIITNNSANVNTIGYEEDSAIFKNLDVPESNKKDNSFVFLRNTYKSGNPGALKYTNNPLDVAIIGDNQYFKIMTREGVRYSLAGNMIRSAEGILVNSLGMPYLSQGNELLEIPNDATNIQINRDGIIYADGEEQARIGVVQIEDKNSLIKEGDSLYYSPEGEIAIDEYTVLSGALRVSNVNSSRIVSQTIEAQRSFSTTNSLLENINETEKQSVSRLLRP